MASGDFKIQIGTKSDIENDEREFFAVQQAGLKTWKTRKIAHHILAHGVVDGHYAHRKLWMAW